MFDLGADHFEFEDLVDVEFIGAGMDLTRIVNFSTAANDTGILDITHRRRLVIRH